MALGRVKVWPLYAVAVIAGALGAVFVAAWQPEDVPPEENLVQVSGDLATVTVRGDVPGMPGYTGAAGFESAFFTLKDQPGEYRYPSKFPRYFEVRDRTSVGVDIWIDPREREAGGPMTIWRIKENNPYNTIGEPTDVGYAEIVDAVTRVDASMVRAGTWMLAIAVPFGLLGYLAQRHNRGLPPPMP
jgi:hypothetical protein